jgi:hypothetical protein
MILMIGLYLYDLFREWERERRGWGFFGSISVDFLGGF